MHHRNLVLNYTAAVAIAAKLLVKHGANDREVTLAVDGTAPIIGASVDIPAELGGRVDVARDQVAEVIYGAAVAKGDRLTADAQGRAVPAAAGQFYVGIAEVAGVLGDVGEVYITYGQEQ